MKRSVLLLLALVAGFAVVAAGTASAVIPPRTCTTMTVKGQRYQIKADQLRCPTAERYARTYLAKRKAPPGYSCRRYDRRTTAMAFRCARGTRVVFAIRR